MFSISVVIPTHDSERFIARAVQSVLSQSVRPDEVLVVDDGSTDDTLGELRQFGTQVRYLYQPWRGQAKALNTGISEVTGKLLAFLDADDVWTSHKLEFQLEALRTSQDEAVFGYARQRWPGSARDGEILAAYLPSAMLIRKDALSRIGGFDEGLAVGSVVDWFCRALAEDLNYTLLPRVVYERWIHGENFGVRAQHQRSGYIEVVRRAIRRRKLLG